MIPTFDYQTALFDLLAAMEACPTAVVIMVYENGDPRMHGAAWEVDDPPSGKAPTFTLSDDLYDLYCKWEGTKNTLRRPKV